MQNNLYDIILYLESQQYDYQEFAVICVICVLITFDTTSCVDAIKTMETIKNQLPVVF